MTMDLSDTLMYKTLEKWAGQHGIILTPGSGMEFSPSLLVSRVWTKPDFGLPGLLHEMAHAYLFVKSKLEDKRVVESLMNGTYMDIQHTTPQDLELEKLRLGEEQLGASDKAKLREIFGEPTSYKVAIAHSSGTAGEPYRNYIGNLVDESRTTQASGPDEYGHSMSNYSEFFASVCVTALDGNMETFGSLLEQFQQAAKWRPDLKPLVEKTCRLLSEAVRKAQEFVGELKEAAGLGKAPPEVERMELNLANMAKMLQTMQPLPTKVGEGALQAR